MTSYAGTASGPRLGSRCSDEEMGGEQRASVPVVLDDSNPDAVIDDVASQLPTAESVPAISSKSSVNPARGAQGAQGAEGAQDAQDMDTADVASVRFQPIPSHDDDLAGIPQRRAAKTQPSRHAQSLSAPSHPATQTQTPSINTDIPSLTVVSSTPVSPTAPESFGPTQEDRLPPTGRSTPVNDRDRRQSRRRSVMDNPRISGFLNNFLHIHREREPQSNPPSPQSPAYAYGRPSSPQATKSSKDITPATPPLAAPVVSRPPTPPPPSLPPPTLSELGITLSQLSGPLPPPFPTSGVFLAPSYILLCNQHGLDVMPLPLPGQQAQAPIKPYALIRRVPFKSCIVMEERGVLVAIAGRRDGVRVYALEEVRRAVEWRIDVEVRKEIDRLRREEIKRLSALPQINLTLQTKQDAAPKSAPPVEAKRHMQQSVLTKSPSMDSIPAGASTPGRAATPNPAASATSGSRKSSLKKKPPKIHKEPRNRDSIVLSSRPPPLPPALPIPTPPPAPAPVLQPLPAQRLIPRTSIANLNIHRHATRRAMSAREAMAAPVPQLESDDVVTVDVNEDNISLPTAGERMPLRREPTKGEWMGGGNHSDEEALVAAGPSGSAALDERTSAAARASVSRANSELTSETGGNNNVDVSIVSSSGGARTGGIVRRSRPSNLNLSPAGVQPEQGEGDDDDMPSPAPTLLTLRQALQATASRTATGDPPNANSDHDEQHTPTREVISFAEWLLESRLPDAPPLGIGSGSTVRLRGASVGSTGGAPVISLSANTAVGAALVTRYPLSRGYDLYGTRGNGGADTPEPDPEGTGKEEAEDGIGDRGASDTENGRSAGRTGRTKNATQSTQSVFRGGSVRAAGKRKSRRWSVFDGILHPGSASNVNATSPVIPAQQPPAPSNHPISAHHGIGSSASQPQIPQLGTRPPFRRHRSTQSQSALSTDDHQPATHPAVNVASDSEAGYGEPPLAGSPSGTRGVSSSRPSTSTRPHHSRLSRFFHLKSSKMRNRSSFINEEEVFHALETSPDGTGAHHMSIYERRGPLAMNAMAPAAHAPKLEYIKLPGTKGAIMVKSVETARKSFLAILCGEAGEKVELFAGTYRTALGLSRTFILPDSPKTIELQLQGDDLVEVFLVFPQNVFGLEPATVRVREVRIGRAERRAARRRAARSAAANAAPEDLGDVNVNVVVGTGAPVPSSALESPGENDDYFDDVGVGPSRPFEPSDNPTNAPTAPTVTGAGPSDGLPPLGPPTSPHPDEIAVAQLTAMGPYTTFQQLSFAPPFPLETLAEECVIPPTYKSLLEYKAVYEPERTTASNGDMDEEHPLTPPATFPVDVLWFYRDPKGVVQGPWKASLMQSWFKDGFLPPDLPVRRESETLYTILRDLRRQSIDPSSPFRPPPPGLRLPDHVRQYSRPEVVRPEVVRPDGVNRLLDPISLLTQPKHFGPPALFFSSRGGHSTSIVDARGRSVLKGRLNWTLDDQVSQNQIFGSMRLGDVKRLEAFEVDKAARAVVVAFRQGGIEATDVGDAIMTPGDGCRTVYPYFDPPPKTINRRRTYVWRVGDDVEAGSRGKVSQHWDLSAEGDRSRNGNVVDASNDTVMVSVLGGNHHFGRKASVSRGAGGELLDDDRDPGLEDILVIGRDEDKVYFCDRRAGTFRLLCLAAEK